MIISELLEFLDGNGIVYEDDDLVEASLASIGLSMTAEINQKEE